MKFKKQLKMVEHKLTYIVGGCRNFAGFCNFTNKANLHTSKEKTKVMPFWRLCCESESILSKRFRLGYPGWSVHMRRFSPGYRDLGRKNRDLGNRAFPHVDIFTKKRVRGGEISENSRQSS